MVKQEQLFWLFFFYLEADTTYQSHERKWKLWDKLFKMISSWAKTLKWVKHEQLFEWFLLFGSWHYLSNSWMHVKTMRKVFFKMISRGKDFKTGQARANILFVFGIRKLTLPIKVMNACENFGTSFLKWFQVVQRL